LKALACLISSSVGPLGPFLFLVLLADETADVIPYAFSFSSFYTFSG